MEQAKLSAQLRDHAGKGPSRRLRNKGMIPAVLYGPKTKSTALALNLKEFRNILGSAAGANVVIDLNIQEGDGVEHRTVMVKDYQIHPIKRTLIHADLYEVSLTEKIRVFVPLHLVGHSPGLEKGGTLSPILREVEIECFPGNIPERIDVDTSRLDLGDSIHVEDLVVPPEIRIVTDRRMAVAMMAVPSAAEEKVERAEEEGVPEAAETQAEE